MLLNVAAKATGTTLRILVISFLKIRISIRSLIALLRFYEFPFLLVASISLLLVAPLPLFLVAFQKLMLLNFIDGIIAILINILLCGANWLIIFNQNCLSVNTVPLLATYCRLVGRLGFGRLSVVIFNGSPLVFLLTRSGTAWPVNIT